MDESDTMEMVENQYNNQLYKRSSNKLEMYTEFYVQLSFAYISATQYAPLQPSPVSIL